MNTCTATATQIDATGRFRGTALFLAVLVSATFLAPVPALAQQDSGSSGFHTAPTQTEPHAAPDRSGLTTRRDLSQPIDHGNPARTQESQYLNNPNASMMHK
jgi:hypothetical protein